LQQITSIILGDGSASEGRLQALPHLHRQYSFSTDPNLNLKGAPSNHVVPIRELKLSAGAELLVVICGEIMTMPGLPKIPAANHIKLSQSGDIEGLF
jgi:formate--tetrahydrofolate ligase